MSLLFKKALLNTSNSSRDLGNSSKGLTFFFLGSSTSFGVGILAVSFYTIIRAGASNILKQIYTYFALPTTLLSIWLPIIEKTELTYGFTTLFGIHSYIFRFLEKMGLKVLIPNIYYISFDNILNFFSQIFSLK